ncbi:DDE-type integrase/transposase/recombinase [Streptomyces sp. AC602_WCS936]|uniref:DDE-type integrase/transposase/recombinase n=1 Tax=Streptomyces sp. AC602_WCS936 TaxID=2823685 RepID=UPI001C262273
MYPCRGATSRCGADLLHVATWSRIVYVAFVVDVLSRAVVGWSAATSKRAKVVLDALDMAFWRRDPAGTPAGLGLVPHSDAGSRYTSFAFTAHLLQAASTPRSARSSTPWTTRSRSPILSSTNGVDQTSPALARPRRHRTRHRGVGRLVQQPAPPHRDRRHPTSRARNQPLRSTPAPTGGWSQRIEPPPIPEQFNLTV